MGVTAFATSFFPGLTLTKLASLASMIVDGQPASKYFELLTPQLVSYSIVVALPCILGVFLFISLLYIIFARICGCSSKACGMCLKCSSCCSIVQIISCIVGLAGCIGLIVASTQPLIGFTNASRELQTFTDKLNVVTKNTATAGDSILDALLVFSNGTELGSPISRMLGMSSGELSTYITDVSTNSLIGPVYRTVALSDNSFASGVSTLLNPGCKEGYETITIVEDFATNANTRLNLVRTEATQQSTITDLQTRQKYSYFENTSTTNSVDDVKITKSSFDRLNHRSIIGGAVHAINSIVLGVNNSLESKITTGVDITTQWKTLVEEAVKKVFSSTDAYNSYNSNTNNPIPRANLSLPASSSAVDIISFIKTNLDKLITNESDKKLINAVINTFTAEKATLGAFIKAFCTSDLKDKFTTLCDGITDSSTDKDISTKINNMIVPMSTFTGTLKDVLTALSEALPYVRYVQELQLHKDQMEPQYVFDAFVNNRTCPYFISGLVPLLQPGTTLTHCTPSFMNYVPSWARSYTILTLVFPLVTAIMLLFPLTSFTLGLLGSCYKKKSLFVWALICNASSLLCVAIFLAIFGLLAVLIGKVFVVQASALFDNPEQYMSTNYPQIMSIINASIPEEYRKVFVSNVSVDLAVNEQIQGRVFPTLVYTAPSCISVDWSTYAALKGTGKDGECTSSLGSLVTAATALQLPTDDPLYSTDISFPLNFSTFSLTDLVYYNEKRQDNTLFRVLGLPELYTQLVGLLPRAANAFLTLGSVFVNDAEKIMVDILGSVVNGINSALNSQEFKKINLFLQAKNGYALYVANYSTETMRDALYGSSVSSDLIDIYGACTSYVQSYTEDQKPNALSLKDAVSTIQGLNGIKGECIALVQLLRGVAFAAGCDIAKTLDQSIGYATPSSLDTLCAKSGIADFMKTLRTALETLKTSCTGYTGVLVKVLNRTMGPDDIKQGCQAGSASNAALVSERIIRTYPAFAEAMLALLSRGLTVFGWNTSLTSDTALTVVLDTTRAYQRFTDVFTGWSEFSADTVAFISAYSDLISAILSPINIFSNILETNVIAGSRSGRLTSGFSSCFNETIMKSLRALVNDTVILPVNKAISASLSAAIGDKGLATPYTWETIFLLLKKLLFGVGMLESFGAVFLCLYFIWAGFFFGAAGQNNSWINLSHTGMLDVKDNSERMHLMPSISP